MHESWFQLRPQKLSSYRNLQLRFKLLKSNVIKEFSTNVISPSPPEVSSTHVTAEQQNKVENN